VRIEPCVGAGGAPATPRAGQGAVAFKGASGQDDAAERDANASPQWYARQAGELRASKLIGTSVKNAAGETIGDINEVVLGSDGKVAAVVIGVGGFLGIGEREVAVRFDSLQLKRGSDQSTIPVLIATKDSLKAAPEWKWSGQDRSAPTGKGSKPSQ
jgi:hypothetical protein